MDTNLLEKCQSFTVYFVITMYYVLIFFEEISPQELKKCLQKFSLSARKSDDSGRSVIARQN